MGTTVYLFIPLCLFKCHRAVSYITLLWLHQHTSDMCLTQEMQHGACVCVTSWMEVIVPEGHLGVVLKGWRRNWIQLLWKWNKKKIWFHLIIYSRWRCNMEPPEVFVWAAFRWLLPRRVWLICMEENLYLWPLEMKIIHKHVALSRKRREKDKGKKEWLIADEEEGGGDFGGV